MTIIFFSKCLKSDVYYTDEIKESEKTVGFKKNCLSIGDEKFNRIPNKIFFFWQPMRYETPLGFNLSLRQIFLR